MSDPNDDIRVERFAARRGKRYVEGYFITKHNQPVSIGAALDVLWEQGKLGPDGELDGWTIEKVEQRTIAWRYT